MFLKSCLNQKVGVASRSLYIEALLCIGEDITNFPSHGVCISRRGWIELFQSSRMIEWLGSFRQCLRGMNGLVPTMLSTTRLYKCFNNPPGLRNAVRRTDHIWLKHELLVRTDYSTQGPTIRRSKPPEYRM